MRNFQIFISYRRDDCGDFAKEFYELLKERIPSADVYLDIQFPRPGDWERHVRQHLHACTVVLALFGAKWEEAGKGKQSSFAMLDEVRLAFEKRRLVLPVLAGRPAPPDYPDDLSDYLGKQQRYTLSGSLGSEMRELLLLLQELSRYTKPVAFVSSTLAYNTANSTLDGLDYFTNVFALVTQRLHAEGFDTVVKVPPYAYGKAKEVDRRQMDLVRLILQNHSDYRGLIIAPFQVGPLVDALLHVPSASLERFPIATIDKAIPYDERLASLGIPRPLTMENDGLKNGRLAGECACECLKEMKISAPQALVLMGLEGSALRAQGFAEVLQAKYGPAAQIDYTNSNEFTQEDGKACMESWLAHDDTRRCDILFACNDELALGARAALEFAEKERGRTIASIEQRYPMIIGFDGISDVTRRIADKDRWLLNTIDVRLAEQINLLVEAMAKRLRGHWDDEPLTPVVGFRHLNTHGQREHIQGVLRLH